MSKNALGRADEIRTTCLMGRQSDNDGGSVGQGHLPSDGCPAIQRRTLQMKEEEEGPKKRSMALRFHNSSPTYRCEVELPYFFGTDCVYTYFVGTDHSITTCIHECQS
jgi:hypothetical protein